MFVVLVGCREELDGYSEIEILFQFVDFDPFSQPNFPGKPISIDSANGAM